VLESGKPFVQARGEWLVAADFVRMVCRRGQTGRTDASSIPGQLETADRTQTTDRRRRDHRGVEFSAYNIARAGAAALAAGCTVVIRPSSTHP